MASLDPCSISSAVATGYMNAVAAVNRKFNALQRLAELLEQLGDIQGLLEGVNPAALIPLYAINFDVYTDLVTACPFLGLPAAPSNASTAQLQSIVSSAYASMIAGLNLHPFSRLATLQAQMDKVQGRVNETLQQGATFLQCLGAVCNSANVTLNFVNNFQQEFDTFKRGYLASNGQVLTQTMKAKVATVNGLIQNINELNSTVPVVIPSPTPVIPQIAIPTDHPIPLPPQGTIP
jgi:hypothetical protein